MNLSTFPVDLTPASPLACGWTSAMGTMLNTAVVIVLAFVIVSIYRRERARYLAIKHWKEDAKNLWGLKDADTGTGISGISD
jgi:hypothetical protein